ncbi:MAG: diguanylate cyclase [Chitinivibrionales bacterium]|nr:diguanylate cyclase [Chitinivibrionales bacterium]
MEPRKLLIYSGALFILFGVVVQLGGSALASSALAISVLCAGMIFTATAIAARYESAPPAPEHHETGLQNALPQQLANEVHERFGQVDLKVLGSAYAKSTWREVDALVDDVLDACIALARSTIDLNTIAIFFPTHDGGYKIRRWYSQSDCINQAAIIYPGVGVIGSFLKDGLKQLSLSDIVSDSMTLYYYTQDARIRSLMAGPIIVGGVDRGTIIVDSTEPRHFKEEDHAFLRHLSFLCGQAVYYAYLNTEHQLDYARLSAMSNTETFFFQKHDLESVIDKMFEIIPFAISCERVTISLKSIDAEEAAVVRAVGPDSDLLINKNFSLAEKSLISLLYAKNIAFSREFAQDRYENRYFEGEPQTRGIKSFLAVPIGMDQCKGAILLESKHANAFTDSARALLSRLVTSAGLAIEKILVLQQARNLATHDGLTGLNNHRQFQKLLRDEMTRADRYNDQLALVLCDIDYFKKCNDTHGHQFGDFVLAGIARTLKDSIRDGVDIAARYGGEEFALVLSKTGLEQAVETAERIRQFVGEKAFRTPRGEDVHVTMSFGIAVYRKHAKKINDLIKKADKALYAAKENGRNRVEVF